MLEFLKEYKEVIVSGLAVLFTIVSLFIKKRPITEIIDESLSSKVMSFINEAEAKFKCGSDKMQYVIDCFKERYPKEYDRLNEFAKKSYSWRSADDEIKSCVEFILTTPQKKGVNKC